LSNIPTLQPNEFLAELNRVLGTSYANLPDAWLAYLQTQTGLSSKDTSYLEQVWLVSQTASSGAVIDLWDIYLKSTKGYAGSSVPDNIKLGLVAQNLFLEPADTPFDGDVVITFSEAVDPSTVTNNGNGTGSMEFKDSGGWISGTLSTSDNIQWKFNPTSYLTLGDRVTAVLTTAIETLVGGNPYSGPSNLYFNPVYTTPPVLTSVTALGVQNTLVFNDGVSGVSDSMDIKWGTSAGSLTNTITGVTSPYEHYYLNSNTTYYYAIVSHKDGNQSPESPEVSATTETPYFFDDFTGTNNTLLSAHNARYTDDAFGAGAGLRIYNNTASNNYSGAVNASSSFEAPAVTHFADAEFTFAAGSSGLINYLPRFVSGTQYAQCQVAATSSLIRVRLFNATTEVEDTNTSFAVNAGDTIRLQVTATTTGLSCKFKNLDTGQEDTLSITSSTFNTEKTVCLFVDDFTSSGLIGINRLGVYN
jgi:hypothetical protein